MALFHKETDRIPNKPVKRGDAPSLLGMPPSRLAESATSKKLPHDGNSTDEMPQKSESRLIVGPNIKLKGVEIEDCDTLVVEGYVEASMDSRVIEIREAGVYKGKVDIDIAIVHGTFEGELTARERLIVHESGDVSGTVRYGRLAIEEGGRVHGDMDELAENTKHPKKTSASTPDPLKDSEAAE